MKKLTAERHSQIKQQILEEEEEKYRKDKEVLESVKELSGNETYERILKDIEEEGVHSFNFQIVDKPKGEFDKDYDRWVNQTMNGGFAGDDFAGTLSYKLTENQYLQMEYSM